jgi:hypothetical protein
MNRPSQWGFATTRARWIAMAFAAIAASALPAHGEVHVDGSPGAVRVAASGESIGAVLSALAVAFNLQHRSAIDLDTSANPTYAGTIERVIANLLDGYNYIVKKSQGTTEIIVLGRRGEVAIPPPAPKPAPGLLSRWR